MYTLTKNPNQVTRDSDLVVFNTTDGLALYEEYKNWLSSGGVPNPIPVADRRVVIQEQINKIEQRELMPRATRLALLAISQQIAAMAGVPEPQLYVENYEYRMMKDFEAEIKVLRAEIKSLV